MRPQKRDVSFAHSDYFAGWILGQKLAEAPHAAEIAWIVRSAPAAPRIFQIAGCEVMRFDRDFEQVSTVSAGERAVTPIECGAALRGAAAQERHSLIQGSIRGIVTRAGARAPTHVHAAGRRT